MFILNKEFRKIPCNINGIIGESKVHKAGAVKEKQEGSRIISQSCWQSQVWVCSADNR